MWTRFFLYIKIIITSSLQADSDLYPTARNSNRNSRKPVELRMFDFVCGGIVNF